MPFEHALGDCFDRRTVGDVTLLVLVSGRRASREPDRVRPSRLELPDELGADPGGRAGDDGYRLDMELRVRLRFTASL